MKKFINSVLVSILGSMTMFSASNASAEDVLLDKVVAVVNEQIILRSELSAEMFQQAQALAAQNIKVKDTQALRNKVLDNMILEKLQIERAKQIGLQANDDEINQQMQQLAEQNNLSLFELRNRLNLEMPNGFNQVRDDIKNQILIQKLREAEVISQAYVTESEVQNYLKRQALANANSQIKLAHILVALPESATPQQRDQALQNIQAIKTRLENGEDFSQMAVRYSNGSKALQGGDLGWMSEDETPTFFAEALQGMSKGDTSDIIESPSGFHLIKLVDKKNQITDDMQTEYHLHRFIILDDNVDPNQVPESIRQLTENMNSMQDFQALFDKYPDIPAEVNQDSDLGWRSLERIPAVIRDDVTKLDIKQALPPLMTDKGWMILYLDDIREVSQADESQKQQAIQAIRMRKANEMFEVWLRRLRDEAYIRIH